MEINSAVKTIESGTPEAAAKTQKPFQEVWADLQAKMGVKPAEQRQVKKTLDKDDFLKIMITQMKHQDPTKPFESDKLAAEIAQIATVEQLGNVNRALQVLSTKNDPLERLAMTNLIGKTVTVDPSRFPHTEGQSSSLSFKLPSDAQSVKLEILDQSGEVVFTKEMGALAKGPNSFVWDGKKSNTIKAAGGTYIMRLEAKDEVGRTMDTSGTVQARVIGVSYSGKEPFLLVGDGKNSTKIELKNVVQIEDSVSPANVAGAVETAAASAPQKELPPEVAEQIQKFELAAKGAPPAEPAVAPALAQAPEKSQVQESGFPNGLDFYKMNQKLEEGGEGE